MNCEACGKQNVLIEGLGEGKKKVTCQDCGFSTITNAQGQPLLTGDRSTPQDGRQLLEG